jgi:hypothetical protein
MTEDYAGRQVVGMDLHRHRSVLVRMTEDGRKLGTARIANSPAALRAPNWPGRVRTRGLFSKRRTGGTGQRTRWRPRGRRCTWRIRSG